ncbi:MAG TPA: phytanoyl-CoA dioxygenase family protein [Sphingomonas sp.]|nr:phytanoyl-CoA dioxygenase family protein [Sphingomonas sp.]
MLGSPASLSDIPANVSDDLDRSGYCVIEHALEPEAIASLNADLALHFAATPFCKGAFYGEQTKRFGSLLKRSRRAETLVRHPLVLALVERALGTWCDRIQLNLTQAVEIHPGAPAQFAHRDQDMWQGPKGELEYLVNVMWPLTSFTATNGATRIWPGSHRTADAMLPEEQAVAVEAEPGSAILFLGSTLHGGGENLALQPRRGIIVSYCLGWLKPFENQWLVYPPHVARHFDPELAALVGYAQHRPNLGNYEGQCPSILLREEIPDHLAATDALRPDQAEAIAAVVGSRAG